MKVEKAPIANLKQAVVFFIGGAGDKESYYGRAATKIVGEDVKPVFDEIIAHENLDQFCSTYYLSYKEVKGKRNIDEYVLATIPDKENTAIYIVGHSLGGWNGAWLSKILTEQGYYVDLLITLDPVGTRVMVSLLSSIYWRTPQPKSNYWINIYSKPKKYNRDDFIADAGGQWRPPTDAVHINHISNHNHRSAGLMFTEALNGNDISACGVLFYFLKKYTPKRNF